MKSALCGANLVALFFQLFVWKVCGNTLPKANIAPETRPSKPNHHFWRAILVSGRVSAIPISRIIPISVFLGHCLPVDLEVTTSQPGGKRSSAATGWDQIQR